MGCRRLDQQTHQLRDSDGALDQVSHLGYLKLFSKALILGRSFRQALLSCRQLLRPGAQLLLGLLKRVALALQLPCSFLQSCLILQASSEPGQHQFALTTMLCTKVTGLMTMLQADLRWQILYQVHEVDALIAWDQPDTRCLLYIMILVS